ncbi:MAG: class I SAM-dependent methyltransferase [Pseudomonadota bacterium]
MLDWRQVSKNPNDKAATRALDDYLRSVTRIEPVSRLDMVLNFCRGYEVLDIGAGEHDPSYYSEDGWEHGRIVKVAKRAVAIEINPELCAHYRAKGFDFRCVDATSDVDLGDRFDRVFIGDVIEHVNDPVALLAFAKRHLKPGGAILITTPNPFAPRFRSHRGRFHTRYVMANLEHTRWISVSNIYELALRSGLDITAIKWPMIKKPKTGLSAKTTLWARRVQLMFAPLEEVFHEYAFELRVASEMKSAPAQAAEAALA